jgi:hypothetical protein
VLLEIDASTFGGFEFLTPDAQMARISSYLEKV